MRAITAGICVAALLSMFTAAAAMAQRADGQREVHRLFRAGDLVAGVGSVRVEEEELIAVRAQPGMFIVRDFPLTPADRVDLELEQFRVISGRTVIVIAREGGEEEAVPFDPEVLAFFHGRVVGRAGSSVFLSIGPTTGVGSIELGPGSPTYHLSSFGPGGVRMEQGHYSVFPARELAAPGALVPMCGTSKPAAAHLDARRPLEGGGSSPVDGPGPIRGLRQVKLSVEADFEFYSLFEDEQATIDYLVQLYAAVSSIFVRDSKLRFDIVFLRVWTTPNDPWGNNVGWPPAPPGGIAWNVAQLMSGRRDASAGGAASGIGSSYSWVAYGQGSFATPDAPHIYNQDLRIAAHELGHNVGAPHTHDIGLDQCHIASSPPRRGTIMSYCPQTFSGGTAVGDMRLHTSIQTRIRNYIIPRPAFIFDCNQNQIADQLDIQSGFSLDLNSNGIPDECEDCNQNTILDSIDISSGFSLDLNNNGIPDECEPDCNGNGIPDDRDILLGTSQDLNFNGVPDDCETDCNNNGTSDYLEIMANMALDIDRNAELDACQSCSGGIPDLVAVEGANNAWVAMVGNGTVREYHAATGVLMTTAAASGLSQPQDLLITPDRRILVSSGGDNRIVEFNRSGAHVRDLVPAGVGGLAFPTGLLLLPDGSLLVCSRNTHSVLRYDTGTGAFLGEYITPGLGGLVSPHGIALGLNGNVYVTSGDNRILEFQRSGGAFVRDLVGTAANGGLSDPRGILFTYGPPRLIVASRANSRVFEYDPSTGEYRGVFNNGDYRGKLVGPWGVRQGPNGDIFVSRSGGSRSVELHLTNPYIFQFDGRNGNLVRAYVQGLDAQAFGSAGFDFMPGDGLDCNWNQLPDWCDIASGFSLDLNNNGIPDECERCYADCDGTGSLNVDDFTCFIDLFAAGDLRANCDQSMREPVLNVDDFLCFIGRFSAGCP